MRPAVCPIVLVLSSWGFISIANGQAGRCSLTCRDQPSSTAGSGALPLQLGERLEQLAAGLYSAGPVYRTFGGNETASLRSDSISEAPDSRFFSGRRKFLRMCINSCSHTQTSNERSTPQHEDGLHPSSRPANGILRGEAKVRGRSDADSTKKFATQSAKKSNAAKHGHDKSSRISHRKM